MNRLLVTGAAGIVGTALRPLLAARFPEILLTDREEVPSCELAGNESFLRGDLADATFIGQATSDVDAILHLGGVVGPDFTFDEVLSSNIVGTRNVFEAARKNAIPRVVYASSHHAVGFYRREDGVNESTIPRPDSFYGLSKAFGEETGSYYADKFGLLVLSIRIGYVGEQVIDERRLHTWISPRDLMQLVEIGLFHPELHYEIVYGVSNNPGPFFDNGNAERLGYQPHDHAIDHLADPGILDQAPGPGAEGTHVGGHFADRTEELR